MKQKRKDVIVVCEGQRWSPEGTTHRTHWVRIEAPNGSCLLSSELYDSKSNANRAAKRLAKRWGLEIDA
jgi:hypothetical protein